MQKSINLFLAILIIFLGLLSNNLSAQSLSYELIGNYDSVDDDALVPVVYTVKFTPNLPEGYKFCRFEFDVASVETVVPPDTVYVLTTTSYVINVTLYYTMDGGDCSAAISEEIKIYPRAYFTEHFDFKSDSLATLKRVLRNSIGIDDNSVDSIKSYRFFWDFDAKMIPKPEVDFNPNDLSLGQYPNVYYTFPNGGAYEITLKVVDIKSINDTAFFTRIVNITPVFYENKLDSLFPPNLFPNVFTPNVPPNDYFTVESSGTSKLSFKVFSRSGALVYEYKGNVIRWDGNNYYGKPLPQGIYYYLIEDIGPEKKYYPAKGFLYIYIGN